MFEAVATKVLNCKEKKKYSNGSHIQSKRFQNNPLKATANNRLLVSAFMYYHSLLIHNVHNYPFAESNI